MKQITKENGNNGNEIYGNYCNSKGQLDEMEECFDRVEKEQRLNPRVELEP